MIIRGETSGYTTVQLSRLYHGFTTVYHVIRDTDDSP